MFNTAKFTDFEKSVNLLFPLVFLLFFNLLIKVQVATVLNDSFGFILQLL